MQQPRIVRPDEAGIAAAVANVAAGELVAFPTETVYGLGADALRADAVAKIFAAKRRPADNPLIVHVAATDLAERIAECWTPLARVLAATYWPGPLTLVLDAHSSVPSVTRGGLATVAIRVPDHPVAAALLDATGLALAAPSANRSGRPSPTTARHVADDFGDEVALIVDGGPCQFGLESTVVDARGAHPVILREGSVSREDLGVGAAASDADIGASPGTRYRHYAPTCAVEVVGEGQGPSRAVALRDAGRRVGLVARSAAPTGVVGLARFSDAADLARVLFAALRAAEQAVEVVVVEQVEDTGIGRAVMDRLRRAAATTRTEPSGQATSRVSSSSA